jgi:hypothetical protein
METRKVYSFIVKVWAEPGADAEWRISCRDVRSGKLTYCLGFSCIGPLVEAFVTESSAATSNGEGNGSGVSH